MHPHPCLDCVVDRKQSFCPLPHDLRRAFDALKTSASFARGQFIFREDDACHVVFIICHGMVKLFTTSPEGKTLLLRFVGPGEILSAAEAVRHGAYECSAIAVQPSVVGIVPRETFLRFAASHPDVGLRLAEVLSVQYKASQREIRFLAFGGTSTAKLARLLLDYSEQRPERDVAGLTITPRRTHIELAQSIGSTRETVTRVLGQLTRLGILERTGNSIVIRDKQELSRLIETPEVMVG